MEPPLACLIGRPGWARMPRPHGWSAPWPRGGAAGAWPVAPRAQCLGCGGQAWTLRSSSARSTGRSSAGAPAGLGLDAAGMRAGPAAGSLSTRVAYRGRQPAPPAPSAPPAFSWATLTSPCL